MRITTRRSGIWLMVMVSLCRVSAEAQMAGESFEQMRVLVKANETVVVTDLNGRRVKGSLAAIDVDSLSVSTRKGTTTFARGDVCTVRVADGVADGALIGAGIGLGTALGILTSIGSGEGYVLPSAKVGAPLLLTGIGALVGALVDRAHEGRVLYKSPGQTSGPVVSPLLAKERRGVLVSVLF